MFFVTRQHVNAQCSCAHRPSAVSALHVSFSSAPSLDAQVSHARRGLLGRNLGAHVSFSKHSLEARGGVVGIGVGEDGRLVDPLDEPEAEQGWGLPQLEDVRLVLRLDRDLLQRGDAVEDRADAGDGEISVSGADPVSDHVDAARSRAADDGLEVARAAGVAVEPRRSQTLLEPEVAIEEGAAALERVLLAITEGAVRAAELTN